MLSTKNQSHGTQPLPRAPTSHPHPLPRRTSPANSITLRHHRLARDASARVKPDASGNQGHAVTSSARRNSNESQEIGQSDPKTWFDQSNENPTATFDNNIMDVDPPFFQRASNSSNEEKPGLFLQPTVATKYTTAHSSSADDYRSVIDDLTVEIQKLKEELKRYKQKGPDKMRKDKLFEIKFHSLPNQKKRELESILRDFAASLNDSPDASALQPKKTSKHATRDHLYSMSRSPYKHASSSGSNAQPVDSAYASMSTGASAGSSLRQLPMSSRIKSSEQNVESYLRDIPEGLYPRHHVMTNRDKQKLVRRLEQLFTGKIGGRFARWGGSGPVESKSAAGALAPVFTEATASTGPQLHVPPSLSGEPAREAKMLPSDKKTRSHDNISTSNSNGDQTEPSGNGNSSSSHPNNSPPNMPLAPEQRPTRPKDLDPGRVQIPSENVEYIRHLGLVPPDLISPANESDADVRPDAEGWVYLNLLCNLAQLHMINVTPGFVRTALSSMSTKFQLSPDGRKIRWRGGTEGTKFSSDSSANSSHRSPDTDDNTSPKRADPRKRRKLDIEATYGPQSGVSAKNPAKVGPQLSSSSTSFHYKPLFVQRESSNEQTSMEDSLSSFGPIDDSPRDSRLDLSGSGTSNRRKRRHDGGIIYYSGARFCTDLSGDPGDSSPATYMLSSGHEAADLSLPIGRPTPHRSDSGSSLGFRPLSDGPLPNTSSLGIEGGDGDPSEEPPELTDSSDEPSDVDLNATWSDDQQLIEVHTLEPCGLGGILPDDHFMVVVTTRRPKLDLPCDNLSQEALEKMGSDMFGRLASSEPRLLPSARPRTNLRANSPSLDIEYVSGRIKRLAPVPLPPPAIYFPPFSPDWSSASDDEMESDSDLHNEMAAEDVISERLRGPPITQPNQFPDGYPDDVDLTSGDEDGEDPDELESSHMYDTNVRDWDYADAADASSEDDGSGAVVGTDNRSKSFSELNCRIGGSSAATAGGVESGFRSGDDSD